VSGGPLKYGEHLLIKQALGFAELLCHSNTKFGEKRST
jgi:hypothetical protein